MQIQNAACAIITLKIPNNPEIKVTIHYNNNCKIYSLRFGSFFDI